mmetsp:Transcript_8072/g.18736  ORF Transcript_8072/g.18736 Transcript_8072/m.18736 type:complete len:355 (-) Transcript_8072:130-1194(-)
MPINTETPVLVTGGSGYIAGQIIKDLLEAGVTVHATVRNVESKKCEPLVEAGKSLAGELKLFQADLLKEGSFAEAIEGCTTVFHTASPFPSSIGDAQTEVVDPALKGTKNVLNQVNKTSTVKRVVLTSSCLAMYGDAVDVVKSKTGKLNEDLWNTTSSLDYQPYAYSKAVAEKAAWEIAKAQDNWDLVVINPGFVMGPCGIGVQASAQSVDVMVAFGDGTFAMGVPRLPLAVVDVREVSKAHIEAAFRPEAKGRYLLAQHFTDFFEISQTLRKKYGDEYAFAKSVAPKLILMAFGPWIDERMDRKFVIRNIGYRFEVDSSKSQRELGIQYRNKDETIHDMFQFLVDAGLIKKKN